MKKAAFLFLSLIVFSSCLKIGEQETCFDKKQNNGELGEDCGGDCAKPCSAPPPSTPVTPTCNPNNNTIKWGSTTYNVTITNYASGSNYVIRGYFSSTLSVYVTLDMQPFAGAQYVANSSCNISGLYCCVRMSVTGTDPYYNGPVYLSLVNGDAVLVFCNLTSPTSSSNLTGKLTANL